MFSVIGHVTGPHLGLNKFTGQKHVALDVQNVTFFAALLLENELPAMLFSSDAGSLSHYLYII